MILLLKDNWKPGMFTLLICNVYLLLLLILVCFCSLCLGSARALLSSVSSGGVGDLSNIQAFKITALNTFLHANVRNFKNPEIC